MGAGCWYTLHDDRDTRAFWIDLGWDLDESAYDMEYECVVDRLKDLPLFFVGHDFRLYYGEQFEITLENTYYGDGLVVQLRMCDEEDPLTRANYLRCYDKIKRHLMQYFDCRIATSGYTSMLLEAA